jgi:hypothetical protein
VSTKRDELTRLVQELPDHLVPHALATLRQLSNEPAFFASAPGDGTSIAQHADQLLDDGFGR